MEHSILLTPHKGFSHSQQTLLWFPVEDPQLIAVKALVEGQLQCSHSQTVACLEVHTQVHSPE